MQNCNIRIRLKFSLIVISIFLISFQLFAQQKLLIPMDATSQTDHLKAYGVAYRHLLHGKELDWLLNYRGGSFMFDYSTELENRLVRHRNYSASGDFRYQP